MKTVIKIILLLGVVGYLTFAIVELARPTEEALCCGVEVIFTDSLESDFVQEADVMNMLAKHKISPEGQQLSQVDIAAIEDMLKESPYLRDVLCYFTASGKLCVQVATMHPILHVMAQNGEEYYLDRSGENMPVGHYNLNVCVATGKITKDFAREQLTNLAQYINDDEFWSKQVQQIHVYSKDEVSLYPRVGNHRIILGNTHNYEEKLDRLILFYEKGLPKTGWNKYKTINLAYTGQIVCTKWENK